jgi:hypothetical protein
MKRTILIIGLLSVAFGANAQKSYDYGVFLGTTQNHGLYSILPIPDAQGLNYAAGGYYRYSMNPRYSWRGGINAGFNRANLMPNMIDAYGFFEFNFHPLSPKRDKQLLTSYISVGLSYLVDLTLYEKIVNTPTLDTYRANFWIRNIRIPFNVGVRYNATPSMTIGVEWALRKGYQLNYDEVIPKFTPLMTNWRSHVGVTIGYMVGNYCKTCPFYDNERKKLK